MAVIVVTRLRLRDPALLDEFFTDAVAAIEQATKSEGNLGADALADANNAWWSVSAWQDRRQMQAYVDREPHHSISMRLDHFCDEATFVDWEQGRGHLRRLGASQPWPAGLANELAPSDRRRQTGRTHPRLGSQPHP
jgi:quinol monooxygenase YgiN